MMWRGKCRQYSLTLFRMSSSLAPSDAYALNAACRNSLPHVMSSYKPEMTSSDSQNYGSLRLHWSLNKYSKNCHAQADIPVYTEKCPGFALS